MEIKIARRAARIVPVDLENGIAFLGVSQRGSVKFVGGGVEDGEETIVAARRELLEESGLEVDISRLIPISTGINPISGSGANHGLQAGDYIEATLHALILKPGEILKPGPELAGIISVPLGQVEEKLSHKDLKQIWTDGFPNINK